MHKITQRKLDVLRAYVMVTAGHLPRDLGKLLRAMRALIPDLTETDLRAAIAWALTRRALPLRSPNPPRHRSSESVPP